MAILRKQSLHIIPELGRDIIQGLEALFNQIGINLCHVLHTSQNQLIDFTERKLGVIQLGFRRRHLLPQLLIFLGQLLNRFLPVVQVFEAHLSGIDRR